jgi:hypothetical protein
MVSLLSLSPAIAIMSAGTAHAQQVGTAAAVNPASTAREISGNTRTIVLGQSIAHKERIQTTAAGSVQLLFLDKTSMTIGPNSDVSIDEYVYDPQANSGKLAATLAKGAMRFVGGQISHSGEATIKTATAVVGIRGGVSILTNANVYLAYGFANVDAGGGSVTLQAGEYTSTSPGALPTPPGPPPPEFIANFVRLFQSAGHQTGGTAAGTASQSKVAAAEQRVTGSSDPISGTLPTIVTYTPPSTVINAVQQAIQTTAQTQATLQSVASSPQSNPANPSNPTNPTNPSNPSATLTGWVGGLLHSNVNGGPITTYSLLGAGAVILDGTQNRVQAIFGVGGVAIDSSTSPTFIYQFGSVDPNQPGSSTFTSYDTFSAQAAHRSDGSPLSTANGQQLTGHDGQMFNVSASVAAQTSAALNNPNLTICQCEYTRWGFWTTNDQRTTANGQPAADSVIGGTWVAGRLPDNIDVPTTGTASYIGHAIASIRNGTNEYIAAGNFTNTVDFATRTGNVRVTGLDSTNYSGTVNATQSAPGQFFGLLPGNVGNRNMLMVGSFYRSPTSPVSEMGGLINLTGTNYLGSGIFAAAKH